jgi:hypothetical protein
MGDKNSLKLDITSFQNLALAPLSYTTVLTRRFRLSQILFHASVAITETIKTTFVSHNGTNYNVVLDQITLTSEQDYIFAPKNKIDFYEGDKLKIECTNANLTGVIYATIKTEEKLL